MNWLPIISQALNVLSLVIGVWAHTRVSKVNGVVKYQTLKGDKTDAQGIAFLPDGRVNSLLYAEYSRDKPSGSKK